MAKKAKDVFAMVTKPKVTSEGLAEFRAILSDPEQAQDFFDQGAKATRFLDVLNDTDRNLFVQALSAPKAVRGLAEKGWADWVVGKLDTLTPDQVTAILSDEIAARAAAAQDGGAPALGAGPT